jgi:hypothetical protein
VLVTSAKFNKEQENILGYNLCILPCFMSRCKCDDTAWRSRWTRLTSLGTRDRIVCVRWLKLYLDCQHYLFGSVNNSFVHFLLLWLLLFWTLDNPRLHSWSINPVECFNRSDMPWVSWLRALVTVDVLWMEKSWHAGSGAKNRVLIWHLLSSLDCYTICSNGGRRIK